MNKVLSRTFKNLNLGEAQRFRNLAVIPILGDGEEGPVYITLAAALRNRELEVSEASEAGSVPAIRVKNKAQTPVLILDGEELQGAKQNRASNASVLVPAMSDMILNVSCTERGRWNYTSERFADSGVVMERRVRLAKSQSVSEGFRRHQQAHSDQCAVWDEIDMLHETMGTSSPTGAMRDAFEARRGALDECLARFSPVEGQRGFIFAVGGAVMGLDLLSRSDAYGEGHARLLGSYVMEMLSSEAESAAAPDPAVVRKFVDDVDAGAVEVYPSSGLGDDVRIHNETVCGSALVFEQVCIHAALFTQDPAQRDRDDGPRIRGFRQRRRHHL